MGNILDIFDIHETINIDDMYFCELIDKVAGIIGKTSREFKDFLIIKNQLQRDWEEWLANFDDADDYEEEEELDECLENYLSCSDIIDELEDFCNKSNELFLFGCQFDDDGYVIFKLKVARGIKK